MRSTYPLDVKSFVCDAIVWHMSGLRQLSSRAAADGTTVGEGEEQTK